MASEDHFISFRKGLKNWGHFNWNLANNVQENKRKSTKNRQTNQKRWINHIACMCFRLQNDKILMALLCNVTENENSLAPCLMKTKPRKSIALKGEARLCSAPCIKHGYFCVQNWVTSHLVGRNYDSTFMQMRYANSKFNDKTFQIQKKLNTNTGELRKW